MGSISKGMDADIVVWSDDPLSLVIHQLIDHAAAQDRRLDALQAALARAEQAATQAQDQSAKIPESDAKLDVARLNRLVD
ncbi:MAG: hypothetical protein EBX65_06570 [Betaproteobacteria bacterium]|nr:hypothetical protein [Betaproteobacteria bacterium]